MRFILGAFMWLGWAAWTIHVQRRGWVWSRTQGRIYRTEQPVLFWISIGISWAALVLLLLTAIYAAIPWPPTVSAES